MIDSILINIGFINLLLLFFLVLISSFGFPSGIAAMIAFGSLAGNITTLICVIIVSFIAAVCGDILVYEIAKRLSKPVKNKLKNFSFFKKNELKTRRLLSKYESYMVFFTRFTLVSLCAIVSYISGLEKLNRKKFVLAVILGELLFAIIYPLIGFTIGGIFYNLLSAINDWVIVLLLLGLSLYLIRYLISRKK